MSEQHSGLRCVVCRRTPARVLSIQKLASMIIIWQSTSHRIPLCRQHGVEASLTYLGSTLVLGWWGYISFFLNFRAIGVDVLSFVQALGLARPEGDSAGSFALWEAADEATQTFNVSDRPRLDPKRRDGKP